MKYYRGWLGRMSKRLLLKYMYKARDVRLKHIQRILLSQAPHEFTFAKPRATSGATKPVRATRVSRGAVAVAGLVLLAFVAGAALTLTSPTSTTLFPRELPPSLQAWPGKVQSLARHWEAAAAGMTALIGGERGVKD